MTTQSDIENVLWSACDTFRGKIDSSRYKDYILSMLFVKYLSDVYKETKEKYLRQYEGDMARVERAMRRERFTMSDTSTFDYLYENRNDIQIGEKINKALEQIETNNSAKLHNVSARSTSIRRWISESRKPRMRRLGRCCRIFTSSTFALPSLQITTSSGTPINI